MTLLLPLLGFVFVTLLITAGAMALAPANAGRIEERLAEIGGIEPVDSGRYERMILDSLKRIGQVAPKSPSEMGKLQQRLVAAGYRSNEALITFFGIRVGLALLIFALLALPIIFRPNVILALAGAGVGYMLPNILLGRLAKQRQHRIRLSLPDALALRGYAADCEAAEAKLAYDLWYLRHRSLLVDVAICARTFARLTAGAR